MKIEDESTNESARSRPTLNYVVNSAPSSGHGTIAENPVPAAWIARMLRAIGGSMALVVAVSLVGSYVSALPLTTWETPSDVLALGLGVAVFILADWLSVRQWQPGLLGAFAAIVAIYGIAAVETKDIGGLFSTLVLILLGSCALNPGSAYWQAAFSGFCVLDWFVATRILPDEAHLAVDHWITIVAAGALAVFSCHLRRKFEKERAEAQWRIRESEIRLRQILNVSPDSVVILRERDLKVRHILGHAIDQAAQGALVGKRFSELDLYKSEPTIQRFVRDLIEKGSIQNVEVDYRRPGGERVPHLASGSRVEIDGESMLVCFTRDITELKRVQHRLEESERRFRSIFAAMPGAASIIASNGIFLDLNRPMTGSGFRREDLIGRSADELSFWVDSAERREFMERFRRDGRVDSMEVHIGRKGGGSIPSLLSASPLQIEGKSCSLVIAHDISELKETQRKLEESQLRLQASEQRFRGVFEAMPGSAAILDLNGKFLDLNHPLSGSGYTREDFIGRVVDGAGDWLTPDELKELKGRFEREGRVDSFEILSRNKDGSTTPALLSLSPMQINGEPYLLAVTHDVSELKETQRRLEESQLRLQASEQRFRGVFEAMPGMAAIFDREARFVDLNHPLPCHGYSRDEFIGRTAQEMGLFSVAEEREEFQRRLRTDGRLESFELHSRNKDGSVTPILISISRMWVNGQQYSVGAIHDITELKDAQRRAEEGQTRFRKIFEASTDSMLLTDFADGTILDANREFLRQTGYAREEVIGSNFRTLNLWSNREKSVEFTNALRLSGEARDVEDEIRGRDGNVVPSLLSGALIDMNGRRCCLAIASDITRIKKTQQELVEAREAAFAASQAKSEFLSTMSHEIRTPMSAILGMTDVLAETELSQEQRRCLEVMSTNGALLLRLINGILDLAKIESGHLTIEHAQFDLIEVVENVITPLGAHAYGKGLELTARIAPEVSGRVTGDATRVRQILINLIENAIKFTEAGQVALEVDREPASGDSDVIRFTVWDTGIGVPRDKLESIFSSFTQADSSTTRKYGGSGLGLAIVQRLVALMGGEVRVKSEPGKGSNFAVTIPFSPASKSTIPALAKTLDLSGTRVLAVDDHNTNRDILRQIIGSLGAEVVEAGSGEEALNAIREARENSRAFHVVLLDARMPGMNGFETAARIRARSNLLEHLILMLSPDSLKAQLAGLRESGLNSYLIKPITHAGLYGVFTSTLEKTLGPTGVDPRAPMADSFDGFVRARVLVAEDAADNRLLISAYLRNSACEIEFAPNGQLALEKFKTGRYDLVLMDIQMPVMDGHAATRAIRSWEREWRLEPTPIVALTASALDDAGAKAQEAGCNAYVTKPIGKATMIELIRRHVKRSPISNDTAV